MARASAELPEGLENVGEDYLDAITASIPLKRLELVEDSSYATLFFASMETNHITGQTIVPDGGQTLPMLVEAINE